jgi:hypothetical protein
MFHVGNILATFAEGLGGPKNRGWDHLNQEIDRDIDAQKQAIEAKKGRVADMKGLYAEAYKLTGDQVAAKDLARAQALSVVDEYAKGFAAQSQSSAIAAKAQELSAKIQADKVKAMEGLAEYNDKLQLSQIKPVGPVGPAKKPLDMKSVRELGKTLEEQHITSGEEGLKRAREIIAKNKGEIPGSSWTGRLLGSLAHAPVVGGLANAARGTEARQLEGAIYAVGEAQAQANNQKGTEAIEKNIKAIVGNGSQEDIAAGLARAEKGIAARRAELMSGYTPEETEAQRALKQYYTPPEMPEMKGRVPGK